MKLSRTYISLFTLSLLMALFPYILLAQGAGAPPATPIDGGLSLLLAGGVAYGVSKLRKKK